MKQVVNSATFEEAKAHLAGKRSVIAAFETMVNDNRTPFRVMRYQFSDLTILDFLYGSSLETFRGWRIITWEEVS